MRPRTRTLVIPLLALFAYGCGGGGGGGGSPPADTTHTEDPLSLTPANARPVAEGAVRATSALNDLAFLRRQVLSGVVETQPGRLAGLSGSSAVAIGRLLERATPLTAEQTLNCDSGTATIRADAADPQQLLSPGDSGSITYNACVVDQTTLGGSVSFAVMRNQNFPALPFELEIAYTIGNLSAAELGFSKIIQGRFTMVARSAEGQAFETLVEGGPVTWDEGVAEDRTLTTLTDFNATTTQDGATGGYRVEVNSATLVVSGGTAERTITFSTTAPLLGTGDDPPQAGELLLAGDASHLRLVQMENSPTVELWVDADGDGRWEGEPTRTTWTELGW